MIGYISWIVWVIISKINLLKKMLFISIKRMKNFLLNFVIDKLIERKKEKIVEMKNIIDKK